MFPSLEGIQLEGNRNNFTLFIAWPVSYSNQH